MLWYLASFCGLYAVAILYRLFIYPYYVSPMRHLPGPKDHHFLIGQLLNRLRAGSPVEPYVTWAKKWPDADFIRFFSVGNTEGLLVTSLAAYREVTQTKSYSFKRPLFFVRLVGDMIGKGGLAFAEGEEHKAQRRILNGMFSIPNIKPFLPSIQAKTRLLGDEFDRAIAGGNDVVELTAHYSQLTLEVTTSFVLGLDFLALPQSKALHEAYLYIFDPPTIVQLLTFVHTSVMPVRWFPLEANRKYVRANKLLRGILGDVVRRRVDEVKARRGEKGRGLADGDQTDGPGKDMLTFMVEEKYLGSEKDARGWSEQDILDQILTFVAAGHETTGTGLVWATHALSIYPDVQERLYSEIESLPAEPGYAEIEGLRYLNNFCRELLRVFAPGAVQAREASEDVVIQGMLIPKGTEVMVAPAAMHGNPLIWGPDADRFDPDRWVGLTGNAADPTAWAAFFLGPRVCIGRSLAMLELKAVVVELARRFRFESVMGKEILLVNPSQILRPRGGLRVKMVKRA